MNKWIRMEQELEMLKEQHLYRTCLLYTSKEFREEELA